MSKLHRPPAAPTFPFIWHAMRSTRDFNKVYHHFQQQHGDLVWMRAMGQNLYLVSNPAYIKHFLVDNAVNNYPKNFLSRRRAIVLGEGLSTSEGTYWRRHRRMIQPGFQREKVVAMVPSIVSTLQRLLEQRWDGFVRSGEPVHVYREMSRLVLTLMGQLVYSEDPPEEMFDAAFEYMLFAIRPRSLLESILPMTPKMRGSFVRRGFPTLQASSHRINDFAWAKVRERMARAEQPDDLLGLFITARDESGEKFTDVEVRDEFVEFFYGGHVSAGIGLSWMWYLLDQHEAVRERVRDDVERGLGGRQPTAADFPALQYVSQTFDETLRLHSPSPGASRPAIKEDRLGDFDVPVGTLLLSSAYVMHRHPAYWEEPHVFNPDRFAPAQAQARPRFVYIPFGAGQRVCIGAQLASMIATLTGVMVTQRYRLQLVPGRPVEPVTGGAHYPNNLWMKVLPAKPRLSAGAAAVG